MRLFIAEKPSLARAIAEVLPHPHVKKGSYIECGTSDVVAWCAGHILELAAPEEYAAEYKTWSLQHLPIVPQTWKLSPSAPDLLKTIKLLLPKAARVVHAGDPDREGQLLVDEVLDYLGYRGQVDRLLVSDLNPPAVRKALDTMKPNGQFRSLYQAALARQRADWLYGLNLTRLYTVLGRAGGYDGVLSVGRVQTPLLGLVVRRDQEIEKFQPKPFFVLQAQVETDAGSFLSVWKAGSTTGDGFDPEGRLTSRPRALALQQATLGKPGRITKCLRERKAEPAPLPYSLPDLQVDAAKRLHLSPKNVLELCQSLYETHRLITYPRSDCSYLPDAHHAQAPLVLNAIGNTIADLQPLLAGADAAQKPRAFCDAKVSAHHAIIPTPQSTGERSLSVDERNVYALIARRYLAIFFPAYEYNHTRIELDVSGECFVTSGRQPVVEGWHRVSAPSLDDASGDEIESEPAQALPPVVEGQTVTAAKVAIMEQKTKPPKPFTHATLIQAMTGIARYVADPRIKKLLRDSDGIGTPATQASIIQTLFDRHYVVEQGRRILSTPMARALISALPVQTTQPDMTALWEAAMRQIQDGGMPLDAFLTGVLTQLGELVTNGKKLGALCLPGVTPLRPCPSGCGGFLRQRKGKSGSFFGCSRYPDCTVTVQDAPQAAASARRVPNRSRSIARSRL